MSECIKYFYSFENIFSVSASSYGSAAPSIPAASSGANDGCVIERSTEDR